MKRIAYTSILSILTGISFLIILTANTGCERNGPDQRTSCAKVVPELDEADMIAEYLEKMGDPVNCKEKCTITATELYPLLHANTYVVDLRRPGDYTKMHLPGAVNVPIEKLHYHFYVSNKPHMYDKVVLVCYTGQSAAYATSLLRMAGFDNVFALKWGMASWHSACSSKWTKALAEKSILVTNTVANSLNDPGPYPDIQTEKLWRQEMLSERIRDLLSVGFRKIGVKASDLGNHQGAMIVAYCSPEDYLVSHPESAINYPLKASLSRDSLLSTLPADREIILYSRNGFESAYACAFLRVLGYDAHTLLYGMNAFMNTNDLSGGELFTTAEINNFPMEGTEAENLRSQAPAIQQINVVKKSSPEKILKPKPKPVLKPVVEEEGC